GHAGRPGHRVENRERCHGPPAMSKRVNREHRSSLALAIAAGETVAAWARAHAVAKRTAYRWSRSPEVRQLVEQVRRRTIDRAVGRLSKHATAAAEQIGRLAAKAESEAIQLAASRAVLADLMTVSNYATLEARIADVERRIHAQPEQHGPAAYQG